MSTPYASDSADQRAAECFALDAVGKKLGVELLPPKLQVGIATAATAAGRGSYRLKVRPLETSGRR